MTALVVGGLVLAALATTAAVLVLATRCPGCRRVVVREVVELDAARLALAEHVRVVRYRCAACGHEWSRVEPRHGPPT